MRWGQSFVALLVIWTIVIVWCRYAVGRESDSLFISWLVFCPFAGLFAGLACGRLPGLRWLGWGSIAMAFGAFVIYWQAWPWEECASGEEGLECAMNRLFFFWVAGLYAIGAGAALAVGAIIVEALAKRQAEVGPVR